MSGGARPPPPEGTIAHARSVAPIGSEVTVRGWVQRTRSSGGILFATVRDRTGTIQVTARRDRLGDEAFDRLEHVQVEGSVILRGTVADDRRAPGGREIRVDSATIVDPGEPFPIFQEQTEEFRLDHRHLVVRTPELVATLRVKAELLRILREFLYREDVLEMTPPVLTGNSAEGGAEAFAIDYFGRPGYLSQTAQLYLEALIVPHERVYSLTPSFRAEKMRTPRHLTEYLHLEVELAWCDLDELLRFTERMIEDACRSLAERCAEDLAFLGQDPKELGAIRAPFPRMTYAEAIEELGRRGHPVAWGTDFGTAEERALTEGRTTPIFVTRYPREIKAFYMLQSPDDPRTVEAADLLAPDGFGELVGGSCRETDIGRLLERLRAMGVDPAGYEWYLDLRRHGNVPHAGFGLGIERLLRWMARREHIRETTPFPRTPSRHTP
ncbi:MAG: asparagine--tRNA ligase [Thermoplasmata archaeon]